jgi:general stress protein 26
MKIERQPTAELGHVARLVRGIPVAMLTNVDADGALASRPMAALEMDADGAFWFFTDLRSEKVTHLRDVNLSFVDGAAGTYVSLSGRGEIDTDRGRIERLWTPLAQPWFPDGPASSSLALLKFVPDSADCWDAPNGRMVRTFGHPATVAGGAAAV